MADSDLFSRIMQAFTGKEDESATSASEEDDSSEEEGECDIAEVAIDGVADLMRLISDNCFDGRNKEYADLAITFGHSAAKGGYNQYKKDGCVDVPSILASAVSAGIDGCMSNKTPASLKEDARKMKQAKQDGKHHHQSKGGKGLLH